jgi:hypothetical protein
VVRSLHGYSLKEFVRITKRVIQAPHGLEPPDMKTFTRCGGPRTHALMCLIFALALTGCGSGSEKFSAPTGALRDGPQDRSAPSEQWVSVASGGWTMPAETEGYECHTALVTSDEYFTGFRLASPPAAQAELFLTVRPSVVQTGDFGCDLNSALGGEAIYAAGLGATAVTFSGGKGVYVGAGQYLALIVHITNGSAFPVTASSAVEGLVAAAADVTTPIDMFFAGKTAFSIPTGTDSLNANGSCATGAELHVVAELSLMRTLGIRERITATNGVSSQNIFNASFDPLHIVYSSLSSDFDMPANSQLGVECSFENHTGAVVSSGESVRDELCLSGIYRHPTKPPGVFSPFECALGQTI